MQQESLTRAAEHLRSGTTRAARRIAYLAARKAGKDQAEAATIAGINRSTGQRIEARERTRETNWARETESLMKKEQVAALLCKTMKQASESAIQYVAPLAAQYSALQGYVAPVKAQLDIRHLYPDVNAWLTGTKDDDATPSIIDVTPEPKQLAERPLEPPK